MYIRHLPVQFQIKIVYIYGTQLRHLSYKFSKGYGVWCLRFIQEALLMIKQHKLISGLISAEMNNVIVLPVVT